MRAGEAEALIAAVREVAAAEIRPRFRALAPGEVAEKTAHDDLVTIADRAAEAALGKAVRGILPGAAVIGEEAVSADPALLDALAGAERAVVIDPVDGTWNYANGLAVFAVILAVVERGETVWGLLYDPVCDDWVVAEKGGGAWFARPGQAPQRLQVGAQPASAIEAFGFTSMDLYPRALRPPIAAELPGFHRSTSLRCAAHEYRLLAQGRAAFALYAKLNVWDHAAGVLCATEAGGVARLLDGRAYAPGMRQGRLLVTTTEPLWQEIAAKFSFLA